MGKTSLKKRLIGSSNKESNIIAHQNIKSEKKEFEMTHGVDIDIWKFGKNFFSLWDFAGHEGTKYFYIIKLFFYFYFLNYPFFF